jgi:hypothetical protein
MDYLNSVGTPVETVTPYSTTAGVCQSLTATQSQTIVKMTPGYIEYYTNSGSSFGGPQNGNCTRLRQLLTRGPVVVSIHVETGFYQYAKNGIFKGSSCEFLSEKTLLQQFTFLYHMNRH